MAAVSTSYTASVATYTYVSSTVSLTQTYSLPPQTTPFTIPASLRSGGNCTGALQCNWQSSAITAGIICWHADHVDATSMQQIVSECHPPGYRDIFRHSENFLDVMSLAYPGDACPSGWSAACTVTPTISGKASTQTLCCPSGYDTCDVRSSRRYCQSFLSTPASVYVQVAATTGVTLRQQVLLSINNMTSKPLTIYRPVFPLQGRAAAVAGVASANGTGGAGSNTLPAAVDVTSTGTDAAGADNSTSNGLSSGAIAGIAVGSCAAVLGLLGAAIFLFIRRRRRQRAASADGPAGQSWDQFLDRNVTREHCMPPAPADVPVDVAPGAASSPPPGYPGDTSDSNTYINHTLQRQQTPTHNTPHVQQAHFSFMPSQPPLPPVSPGTEYGGPAVSHTTLHTPVDGAQLEQLSYYYRPDDKTLAELPGHCDIPAELESPMPNAVAPVELESPLPIVVNPAQGAGQQQQQQQGQEGQFASSEEKCHR